MSFLYTLWLGPRQKFEINNQTKQTRKNTFISAQKTCTTFFVVSFYYLSEVYNKQKQAIFVYSYYYYISLLFSVTCESSVDCLRIEKEHEGLCQLFIYSMVRPTPKIRNNEIN